MFNNIFSQIMSFMR